MSEPMERRTIVAGTAEGMWAIDPGSPRALVPDRDVTAIDAGRGGWWAILGGRTVVRSSDGERWTDAASLQDLVGRSILATPHGVFVGTSGAHLRRLEGETLAPVEGFERAEGRGAWYTPWGGPPDTRSLSADPAGLLFANVHVGGILRSEDGGASWAPTIDIDTDVHQVLSHPARPGVVVAAAGVGFARSGDGGATWSVENEGLEATYCRAVALSGDDVLVSASRGPGGQHSAVYRRSLEGRSWERCRAGLPEFRGNVDSHCLAWSGEVAALATADGFVFASTDGGESWEEAAAGLPAARCVAIG